MFTEFLDLEQPEERFLNDALTAYIRMNLSWKTILCNIALDFPMMDDIYMRKAELALFNWFNSKEFQEDMDNEYITDHIHVNWIRFLNDKDETEPENSWVLHEFIKDKDSDPSIKTAIHFTNLQYGRKDVSNIYKLYAVTPDGNERYICDVDVKLGKNQLCRTVILPVETEMLTVGNSVNHKVRVLLKTDSGPVTEGSVVEIIEVASKGKPVVSKWNFKTGKDRSPSDLFNIKATQTIHTEILVECNCKDKEGNRPDAIQADMIIEYSNPHRDVFYTKMRLAHKGGNMYGIDTPLLCLDYMESEISGCHIPVYDWGIGTFKAYLFIWDDIVKERSISFCDRPLQEPKPQMIEEKSDVMTGKDASSKVEVKQNTVTNAYRQLMSMPGLESVKETILSMRSTAMFAKQRKEAGLPAHPMNLHSCFIGNSGTGKTTVAKLMGQLFKELGLLSSGHLVEESRQSLVGRFYDSEAKAVTEAVEKAQGGILIIDEASNLYVEDDRDPGKRIIDYLLTEIADENRRDWMLILAGTDPSMTDMLNQNKNLSSRLGNIFYFKDYDEDQLLEIADLYCKERKFLISEEARIHLREVIRRDISVNDDKFGNGRYVKSLMDKIVNINMASRVGRIQSPDKQQLMRIEACDVPSIRKGSRSSGIDDLKKLIGLEPIKESIETHVNYVKMLNLRTKMGLDSSLPPLHMIFTGNPGTGKTTVADLLGEIYASMGILSRGDVIYAERKNLVGRYIGETEAKMEKLLKRAKGNILFIDEAYQLYSDKENDYGKIAFESLMTTLSQDSTDMIVILAGYTKEMDELMSMNAGIPSRFPYVFNFQDYSMDELVQIASHIATRQNYKFTPEAMERLKFLTKLEIQKKKDSFGNARFIKKLITNKIIPAMANRIASMENPTEHELRLITVDDVPLTEEEKEMVTGGGFNEKAITDALVRLDGMVGLEKVKAAIHNFVDVSRYLNKRGEKFIGQGLLKWSFTGNTGTGKSTVAEILAEILKAMNLLVSSEITEIKGEEIFNVPEYQCNEVLTNAMRRARYGMLLIDGDSPECKDSSYYMSGEQLRAKLTSLTAEQGGAGAVIISESASPRQTMASSLAMNGIYDYDHIIFFDDYSAEQLYSILCSCMNRYEISISAEAEVNIKKYICDMCGNSESGYANARTMKHLARTIKEIVILRLSRNGQTESMVLAEDVENFVWKNVHARIGF